MSKGNTVSNQLVLGITSAEDKSFEEQHAEVIVWFPEDLFHVRYYLAHMQLMQKLGEIGHQSSFSFRISDEHEHLFEYKLRFTGPKATRHRHIIEHITKTIKEHYEMEVKFVDSEELKLVSVPLPIPTL